MKKEIEAYYDLGYSFSSVYVGGGTPTIVPDKLADIILYARSLWPITQVSVETNPSHLNGEILGVLKDIGTNRLSVGVQSFDDGILRSVQRYDKYGKRLGLYLCPKLLFLFITRAAVFRDNNIVLTARGRYYWLSIMSTLFSTLGDYRDVHTPPAVLSEATQVSSRAARSLIASPD